MESELAPKCGKGVRAYSDSRNLEGDKPLHPRSSSGMAIRFVLPIDRCCRSLGFFHVSPLQGPLVNRELEKSTKYQE